MLRRSWMSLSHATDFFSPKLHKTDAATTHLRNLSCNHCRKNDLGARSCFQQMDKTSSSVLLSLAQVGRDLNGFEWHLRHFMAHHDKGSYCLPPNCLTTGIHRSSKNPNFCSFHTNFLSTVIFSKYSLLVTFWIPCNLQHSYFKILETRVTNQFSESSFAREGMSAYLQNHGSKESDFFFFSSASGMLFIGLSRLENVLI